VLNEGFIHQGRRITLKGPAGIWFPQGFSIPLSIATALNGPYRLDDIADDGLLTYAYRGRDPKHRDNRGLRDAWRTRTPLIYFREVHEHHYQAIWPVIILEDHQESLFVRAAMDPAYADLRPESDPAAIALSPLDLRRYAWAETRQRLHQGAFRDIIIAAYDCRCTVCRLGHTELLDAAHIIPDTTMIGHPDRAEGFSRNAMVPCSGTACRSWTGHESSCPLGRSTARIRTGWRDASGGGRRRAEHRLGVV
jgi:putative restriction endonuclease